MGQEARYRTIQTVHVSYVWGGKKSEKTEEKEIYQTVNSG